jgi:hypothetical protein
MCLSKGKNLQSRETRKKKHSGHEVNHYFFISTETTNIQRMCVREIERGKQIAAKGRKGEYEGEKRR